MSAQRSSSNSPGGHCGRSGADSAHDPVADMVLTFHLGRLARIAVTYDRERTAGLTNADLHEAMSSVYGTSLLLSTPIQSTLTPPARPEVMGRWEDAGTLVLLWREHYPTRVGLTIVSISADREAQVAIADGLRIDASEVPARILPVTLPKWRPSGPERSRSGSITRRCSSRRLRPSIDELGAARCNRQVFIDAVPHAATTLRSDDASNSGSSVSVSD